MSSAPGSEGGRLKTPGTSVRKTASLGRSARQSTSSSASPERMPQPSTSSTTESPCMTGIRPARSSSRTWRTPARAVRAVGLPARFRQSGKGGRCTAGSPAASSASSTSAFSLVADLCSCRVCSGARSKAGTRGASAARVSMHGSSGSAQPASHCKPQPAEGGPCGALGDAELVGLKVTERPAPVHKQYAPVAARGPDLLRGRGQRRPVQGLKRIFAGHGRPAELHDDSWAVVGARCCGR